MKSARLKDYQILVKKDEGEASAYCPQLNVLFKGGDVEEAKARLINYIEREIDAVIESSSAGDFDFEREIQPDAKESEAEYEVVNGAEKPAEEEIDFTGKDGAFIDDRVLI